MHLQQLIPSLKLACSTAIARHSAQDINADACLALGLDANDTVQVFLVNDLNTPIVPSHINSAIAIFSGGLIPLVVTLAGMDLAHEVAVERMTNVILPKISTWIFNAEPKDARFLEVGSQLSTFAANGIIAAINTQTQSPEKTARLADCKYPERN